jgi:signal transduction histidine kinase
MTNRADGPLRRRRAWWREASITATAFASCLLGGVFRVDDTLSSPPTAAYLVAVLSCAVLPMRHRAPRAALATTIAVGMLVAPLGLLLTPLLVAPAVVAAYSLALRSPWRTAIVVLVFSAGLLVAPTAVLETLSWRDASRLGSVAAALLVAGVLGRSTKDRHAYLAVLQERARRAEEDRDSEARRRVAEERVRIARELHDLVAHQITLASAQATVADHLFDSRPEQARASLTQLVETTRNALDGLRATVGLLRQSGAADTLAEPTPGLSLLPTLLESFRRAGLEVSVHVQGTAAPLSPEVDLTAYRIIQESLTNVTKHSGAGAAEVRLAWHRDRVTITIDDDGGPGVLTASDHASGYGLIGMRERATAVGGELTAGARPEGGFLVATHLPLPLAKETTQPADSARAGSPTDVPAEDAR